MRVSAVLTTVFLFLVPSISAWTEADHEIFRLQDEIISHEGSNATFYTFVGARPSSPLSDLNSAYKKQSRLLHPDKARAVFLSQSKSRSKKPTPRELKLFDKESSARFARLGVIMNILRDGEKRERYDHFLKNGFPKWRGTGYYYKRFRPGLGSVLTGLFIFVGGGFHYIALYIGWKKQQDFVQRYINSAKRMAGGSSTNDVLSNVNLGGGGLLTPQDSDDEGNNQAAAQTWNRREKRAMAKEKKRDVKKDNRSGKSKSKIGGESPVMTTDNIHHDSHSSNNSNGPVGAKKRTVAENGKVLIVDSTGKVWLEEEDEEGEVHEFLLDPNEIPRPTIYDTILFKLPQWTYHKTIGRFTTDSEVIDMDLKQKNDEIMTNDTHKKRK